MDYESQQAILERVAELQNSLAQFSPEKQVLKEMVTLLKSTKALRERVEQQKKKPRAVKPAAPPPLPSSPTTTPSEPLWTALKDAVDHPANEEAEKMLEAALEAEIAKRTASKASHAKIEFYNDAVKTDEGRTAIVGTLIALLKYLESQSSGGEVVARAKDVIQWSLNRALFLKLKDGTLTVGARTLIGPTTTLLKYLYIAYQCTSSLVRDDQLFVSALFNGIKSVMSESLEGGVVTLRAGALESMYTTLLRAQAALIDPSAVLPPVSTQLATQALGVKAAEGVFTDLGGPVSTGLSTLLSPATLAAVQSFALPGFTLGAIALTAYYNRDAIREIVSDLYKDAREKAAELRKKTEHLSLAQAQQWLTQFVPNQLPSMLPRAQGAATFLNSVGSSITSAASSLFGMLKKEPTVVREEKPEPVKRKTVDLQAYVNRYRVADSDTLDDVVQKLQAIGKAWQRPKAKKVFQAAYKKVYRDLLQTMFVRIASLPSFSSLSPETIQTIQNIATSTRAIYPDEAFTAVTTTNTQMLLRQQTYAKQEESRTEAELAQLAAEASQKAAEFNRVAEQQARQAEEQARKAQEEARQAEQQARQAEEQARKAEEQARKAQEEARKAEQQARQAGDEEGEEGEAEKAAESARIAEEAARKAAEDVRAAEEAARKAAEDVRAAEEAARKATEENRTKEQASQKLRADAEAAVEAARKAEAEAIQEQEAARVAAEEARLAKEAAQKAEAEARVEQEQARVAAAEAQRAEAAARQAEREAQAAAEEQAAQEAAAAEAVQQAAAEMEAAKKKAALEVAGKALLKRNTARKAAKQAAADAKAREEAAAKLRAEATRRNFVAGVARKKLQEAEARRQAAAEAERTRAAASQVKSAVRRVAARQPLIKLRAAQAALEAERKLTAEKMQAALQELERAKEAAEVQRRQVAATRIQALMRGRVARTQLAAAIEAQRRVEDAAATQIQAIARRNAARIELARLKRSAESRKQAAERAERVARTALARQKKDAAIKIQAIARMSAARKQYLRTQEETQPKINLLTRQAARARQAVEQIARQLQQEEVKRKMADTNFMKAGIAAANAAGKKKETLTDQAEKFNKQKEEAERQIEQLQRSAREAADAERVAEAAVRVEIERLAEAEREAEAARQAEAARRAEAERQAEEERRVEAERLAEIERQAEAQRQADAAEAERIKKEAAAAQIQALARMRSARRKVQDLLAQQRAEAEARAREEGVAATAIQKIARGKLARQAVYERIPVELREAVVGQDQTWLSDALQLTLQYILPYAFLEPNPTDRTIVITFDSLVANIQTRREKLIELLNTQQLVNKDSLKFALIRFKKLDQLIPKCQDVRYALYDFYDLTRQDFNDLTRLTQQNLTQQSTVISPYECDKKISDLAARVEELIKLYEANANFVNADASVPSFVKAKARQNATDAENAWVRALTQLDPLCRASKEVYNIYVDTQKLPDSVEGIQSLDAETIQTLLNVRERVNELVTKYTLTTSVGSVIHRVLNIKVEKKVEKIEQQRDALQQAYEAKTSWFRKGKFGIFGGDTYPSHSSHRHYAHPYGHRRHATVHARRLQQLDYFYE